MKMTTPEAQYLHGKIEAVSILVSTLTTVLSPQTAKNILAQCEDLRARVPKGGVVPPFVAGYLEIEPQLLLGLKSAEDADKISRVSVDVVN